jgi:hypothetical protein
MDPDSIFPDQDPDLATIVSDLQDGNKNLFFLVFCLLFEAPVISFFKDKKSSRSEKNSTVGIKVFLTIFAGLLKDPDPDPYIVPRYWIRIGIHEAQNHTDSTDPDPQH